MAGQYDSQIRQALDYLVQTQNPDGGWGYKPGGQSFTEPTAMALIALFSPLGGGSTSPDPKKSEAIQKGLLRLRADQHSDGGWGIFKDDAFSNWMTYPTVWAFNLLLKIPEIGTPYGKPEDLNTRNKGRDWILKAREPAPDAEAKKAEKIFRMNFDYRGWRWGSIDREAGWVIPTSLAVIALTIEDPAVIAETAEVQMGKDYLRDRACPSGGWNCGNPYVFDKELPASPDATCYALLALAMSRTAYDFGKREVITVGVDKMSDFAQNCYSDATAAFAALCLRFYLDEKNPDPSKLSTLELVRRKLVTGKAMDDVEYAAQPSKLPKTKGQLPTGAWADNPYVTAMAILALSETTYFIKPI